MCVETDVFGSNSYSLEFFVSAILLPLVLQTKIYKSITRNRINCVNNTAEES